MPASAATQGDPQKHDAETKAGTSTEIVVTGERESYVTPVVSGIRIDAKPLDIPQTIDVVPEGVLRDQRALSLTDSLRNVAGIGFATGDGQRDQFTIRGFDAQGDIFVDGIRDDALYFRDLSNIERVEVIKGPASVLFGRGSSGGLINLVTRKPGTEGGSLALTYGSWDDRRIDADIGHVIGAGEAAVRITGAIERADSYRDKQFLDRETIAPSFSAKLGERTTLLVQADYLRDKRLADNGIPSFRGRPIDVPRSTYYGAANARDANFAQSEVWSSTARIEHSFSDAISLRNVLRYYDYSLDRQDAYIASVNEVRRTATLSHGNTDRQEDGWFDQLELTARASTGAIGHRLLVGMEIGSQNKRERRLNAPGVVVDLFDPVLPIMPEVIPGNPRVNRRNLFDVFGLYVQDLASIGEQWKVLAGLRFDRFEQRSRPLQDGQADLSRTDHNVSPRLGIVWQPTPEQSYYVSWSRSFQPSAEMYGLSPSSAEIAPESTRNYEAGAKYNLFDGALLATASIFDLRRSNIKATDPVTLQLVPVGIQRTRGIELSVRMSLPQGWNATASYAYLDAKTVESPAISNGIPLEGKQPSLVPENSASLWVTHDFGQRFTVGGGANYVGDRFADPTNTVLIPDYVTLNAMASARISPFELQVNLYNITDENYIVSAHGFLQNSLLPGAPRSVLATLRYAF